MAADYVRLPTAAISRRVYLTAQQGLGDVVEQPLLGSPTVDGVLDGVGMVLEALSRLQPRGAGNFVNPASRHLRRGWPRCETPRSYRPTISLGWCGVVEELKAAGEQVPDLLKGLQTSLGLKPGELTRKVESLHALIDGLHADVQQFVTMGTFIRHVSQAVGQRAAGKISLPN